MDPGHDQTKKHCIGRGRVPNLNALHLIKPTLFVDRFQHKVVRNRSRGGRKYEVPHERMIILLKSH